MNVQEAVDLGVWLAEHTRPIQNQTTAEAFRSRVHAALAWFQYSPMPEFVAGRAEDRVLYEIEHFMEHALLAKAVDVPGAANAWVLMRQTAPSDDFKFVVTPNDFTTNLGNFWCAVSLGMGIYLAHRTVSSPLKKYADEYAAFARQHGSDLYYSYVTWSLLGRNADLTDQIRDEMNAMLNARSGGIITCSHVVFHGTSTGMRYTLQLAASYPRARVTDDQGRMWIAAVGMAE